MKRVKLLLLPTLCLLTGIACQSNENERSNEYLTLTMNETDVMPNSNNAMAVSFVEF